MAENNQNKQSQNQQSNKSGQTGNQGKPASDRLNEAGRKSGQTSK